MYLVANLAASLTKYACMLKCEPEYDGLLVYMPKPRNVVILARQTVTYERACFNLFFVDSTTNRSKMEAFIG